MQEAPLLLVPILPPALAEIDGARTAAAVEEGLGCATAGRREGPSPPAGQGPSRLWRGRRDKGLFCTVLLENGMRALDSILTLLHNRSWSFRVRQVSVDSTESKVTRE